MQSKPIETASILAIGTELVTGQVIDTNSSFLANELNQLGISCSGVRQIPDEVTLMEDTINALASHSDLLIITGGLGPTDDDMTVDVLAKVLSCKPRYDEEAKRKAETFFKRNYKRNAGTLKNITNGENNLSEQDYLEKALRQTRIPQLANSLKNLEGLAPGVTGYIDECLFFAFPGFPRELKSIWPQAKIIISQTLPKPPLTATFPLWTIGESQAFANIKVDSSLFHLYDHALPFGCKVSIGATKHAIANENYNNLKQSLEIEQGEIRKKYKNYICENPLIASIAFLSKNSKIISTVESCTGGLAAKLITDQPGASKVFHGGVITYSNQMKTKIVGVNPKTIEKFGAVSQETIFEMSIGGLTNLSCDYSLAFSGIAGPQGGTKEKPLGLVYIGIADKQKQQVYIGKFILNFGRDRFRTAAVYTAFTAFYQLYCLNLQEEEWENNALGSYFLKRSF